ncbi:hypothetical protein [Reichenbachiella sp. MALMAid0571]|uniref:hypothetical protein n=1 Tax=Reichenbachiella sp. MALMAid0571 TaxID=3143939 RepID=UPI0032E04AEF
MNNKIAFLVFTLLILIYGCKPSKPARTESAMIPINNQDIVKLQRDLITFKFTHDGRWPTNTEELKSGLENNMHSYTNFERLEWKEVLNTLQVNYFYNYPDHDTSGFENVKGKFSIATSMGTKADINHKIDKAKKRRTSK